MENAPPTPNQRDAARLLEFGAFLAAAPEKSEEEAERLRTQAIELVAPLTIARFLSAIRELRLTFLGLVSHQVPTRPSGESVEVEMRPVEFLEWLTRLDLARALAEEKNLGAEFRQNCQLWLALDKQFGPPENFWVPFCELRKGLQSCTTSRP